MILYNLIVKWPELDYALILHRVICHDDRVNVVPVCGKLWRAEKLFGT